MSRGQCGGLPASTLVAMKPRCASSATIALSSLLCRYELAVPSRNVGLIRPSLGVKAE
jgi:hypothetical protein